METKKTNEKKKCQVCGKLKEPSYLRSTSNHTICYDCAKVAIEEKLLVEDCDGLLYEYTEDRMNWIKEVKE